MRNMHEEWNFDPSLLRRVVAALWLLAIALVVVNLSLPAAIDLRLTEASEGSAPSTVATDHVDSRSIIAVSDRR
jgi:hypothetical protein